ncbi:MAG: uroporphyrinogen-III C-methyltransferase [Pseudomonadota bacterium]|nr:uroporphyrinogen-III C-methyltransferase [Pseudomonadota bacterium]
MSPADQPNEPAAPEGARPDPVTGDPSPKRPARAAVARPERARGGSLLAWALLLALLALVIASFVGWRQWQQQTGVSAAARGMADLRTRVSSLETTLTGVSDQRSSFDQRLNAAAAVNRSLREELLGQAERTRNLEDAVAKLAEKSLSAHDTILLDETDSLLRMGNQRYLLFHDPRAAAAAYALADQTLAAVNDGAFSGVRLSIEAEHDALLKSRPASQDSALQQLQALRDHLASLPLKPLDKGAAGQPEGAWSRIGHALAGVVTVQRDNGAPLAVADARFARELTALDLAQAQAALLAYDSKGYAAALQRASASLASQFDGSAKAVRQARGVLEQLGRQLPPSAPVELGAALTELRNLRAVHALTPSPDATPPAHAGSVARKGGARP